MERDLNSILDKINREGFKSLTQEEEERLYKNSKNYQKVKRKINILLQIILYSRINIVNTLKNKTIQ